MSFTRSIIVSLRQSRVLLRSNTTTTTTALKHNRLMSNLIQKNSTCLHRTNPLGHQNLQFLKPICTRSMATKTAEQATETESDQEMSEFLEEEISIEYQTRHPKTRRIRRGSQGLTSYVDEKIREGDRYRD